FDRDRAGGARGGGALAQRTCRRTGGGDKGDGGDEESDHCATVCARYSFPYLLRLLSRAGEESPYI
ncbi:hypothetical protein N9L76_09885, partial [bacterium]|nr:hypothetical protein [bacterium]